MKKLLLSCLPLALAACSSTSPVLSSDAAPELRASFQDGADAAGMDEMAAMMNYMTPGKAHEQLASLVGRYDIDAQVYMAPGTEPVAWVSKGTSKMVLGGRYLVEESAGTMMGMPVEGRLTMGYNNLTEEWWSFWIDNMSTGHSVSVGKADEAGVIRMDGTMVDATSPEGRMYAMVMHPVREDGSYQVDMLGELPDGSEWTVMTMTYTPTK